MRYVVPPTSAPVAPVVKLMDRISEGALTVEPTESFQIPYMRVPVQSGTCAISTFCFSANPNAPYSTIRIRTFLRKAVSVFILIFDDSRLLFYSLISFSLIT